MYRFAFATYENEKETGAEMPAASVYGMVTGDAPGSYWPIFFPVPNNRTRNLCERLLGPVIPSHFWSGELRRQMLTIQLRDFINYIFLADFLHFFQDYLETKRLVFARFYFLSNEDLLDILANSKNPNAVQVSSD